MARERIAACELSWIIIQSLRKKFPSLGQIAFAVVPDNRHGWRVLLPNGNGQSTSIARFAKDIEVLEKKLRGRYALTDE